MLSTTVLCWSLYTLYTRKMAVVFYALGIRGSLMIYNFKIG